MKDLKSNPVRPMDKNAMSNDMVTLNALLSLVNNTQVTGAIVPPEEKALMKKKSPPSSPVPPPTIVLEQTKEELTAMPVKSPDAAPQPAESIVPQPKITAKAGRLIVLTGRPGSGRRFIAKQLQGVRHTLVRVTNPDDYRTLAASGADMWHVMAAESTRNRRLGSISTVLDSLAATLDQSVVTKVAGKGKLHVIWNDEVKAPSNRFYSLDEFLSLVSE